MTDSLALLLLILNAVHGCSRSNKNDNIIDSDIEYLSRSPNIEIHDRDFEYCEMNSLQDQATTKSMEKRIVGNKKRAEIEKFPWMISLVVNKLNGKKKHCGGFLISSKWVLTSAQCFSTFDAGDISFGKIADRVEGYAGSAKVKKGTRLVFSGINIPNFKALRDSKGIISEASRQLLANEFTMAKNFYISDIAALEISQPVDFTSNIRPLCLPRTSHDYVTIPTADAGQVCVFAGWGFDFENIRDDDALYYISMKRTAGDLEQHCPYLTFRDFVAKYGFCLGGGQLLQITEKGDSGGPLVCQDDATKKLRVEGVFGTGIHNLRYNNSNQNSIHLYVNIVAYLKWLLNKSMFDQGKFDQVPNMFDSTGWSYQGSIWKKPKKYYPV